MNTIHRILLITLLALGMGQTPAVAQAHQVDLLNLDFKGGTVLDYVDALRKAAKTANIVVAPDAEPVRMSNVKLQSVDLHSALRVLDGLTEQDGSRRVELGVDRADAGQPLSAPIYMVHANVNQRGPARSSPVQTMVLSVNAALDDDTTSDALLTAIETTLQLFGDRYPPAQLRYHEDTALIIARGHPDQMESIAEVIKQVQKRVDQVSRLNEAEASWAETREQARVYEARVADLERELEMMNMRMQEAMRQREQAHKETQDMRARLESAERMAFQLRQQLEQKK